MKFLKKIRFFKFKSLSIFSQVGLKYLLKLFSFLHYCQLNTAVNFVFWFVIFNIVLFNLAAIHF